MSVGQIAPQQRLAAGDADAIDAELAEGVGDRARSPRTMSSVSRGSQA